MGREVERKFLTTSDAWRAGATGTRYRQGYIVNEPRVVVRVRSMGPRAVITVKAQAEGIARSEYEYDIPLADAEEMLDRLCGKPLIEKTRYEIPVGAHRFEVDEFFGANAGLVVAEVELDDEHEAFERPAWLGEEVTADPRYLNSSLVRQPYSTWKR